MSEPLGNQSGLYIYGTNVPIAHAMQQGALAREAQERMAEAQAALRRAEAERAAQARAAREAAHAAAIREADMSGLPSGGSRPVGALVGLPVLESLGAEDLRAGPYELRARLGDGHAGQVYLGFLPSGQFAAVKIVDAGLATDRKFQARFGNAVTVDREISGEFIARVVDVGRSTDPPWLATELILGPSLADIVSKLGPLSGSETWCLASGLARALTAIHRRGLIHRGLKPSNVLFAADGVRIIHAGISEAIPGSGLLADGRPGDTVAFTSPEQAVHGISGAESDVFSLGALLSYAATGRYPFGSGPACSDVLNRVASSEPDLDGITGPLRDIITRCLAKHASRRPELSDIQNSSPKYLTASDAAAWPEPFTESLRECQREFARRVEAARPPATPPIPTTNYPSQSTQPSVPVRRDPHLMPPSATHRRRRLLGALMGGAAVIAIAASVAAWFLSRPAWIAGTGTAYVTSSEGIVPVNLATGQIGNPISVGGSAYGLALSPRGDKAYVVDETACQDCSGTVGTISLLTVSTHGGPVGKATFLAQGSPAFQVVLSPDSRTAYVMTANGVIPVDVATGDKGTLIKVGDAQSQIAVSPSGRTLYVTAGDGKDLFPVNAHTGAIGKPVKLISTILAVAVAPGGGSIYAYVAGGIASVSAATWQVTWQVTSPELGDGGATGGSLVITPDGQAAYAGGAGTGVVPINLRTHQVGQMINEGEAISTMAMSPDGKTLYVGSLGGAIYPISVPANQVGKSVSIGGDLQAMAILS